MIRNGLTPLLVKEGEALALIGSAELMEIAVNRGSAAERFGAHAKVEISSPTIRQPKLSGGP